MKMRLTKPAQRVHGHKNTMKIALSTGRYKISDRIYSSSSYNNLSIEHLKAGLFVSSSCAKLLRVTMLLVSIDTY